MNKFLLFLCVLIFPLKVAFADEGLFPININIRDTARLQRGAKIFMNYCSGCHSLRFMRYNRMATDLGLTSFTGEIDNDLLINNLIFTKATVYDPIVNSMSEEDARQWFGKVPPDLSLKARERGAAWLYTYLKSFYVDKARPFGTNNTLLPDVAMPNVLAPLEGTVIVEEKKSKKQSLRLVLIEQGEMNQNEFDSTLQDLVTFLVYVAEPAKLTRYRVGVFVLIFLGVFLIVGYQLKKIYWKNIHRKHLPRS